MTPKKRRRVDPFGPLSPNQNARAWMMTKGYRIDKDDEEDGEPEELDFTHD